MPQQPEKSDKTYPVACPSCHQIKGFPQSVATDPRSDGITIRMHCLSCDATWQVHRQTDKLFGRTARERALRSSVPDGSCRSQLIRRPLSLDKERQRLVRETLEMGALTREYLRTGDVRGLQRLRPQIEWHRINIEAHRERVRTNRSA